MLHTYPDTILPVKSMARVGSKNLTAYAFSHQFGHRDNDFAMKISSGEVEYRLTGTREDMLAIAQAICECVGADIYDPKDDADSELK